MHRSGLLIMIIAVSGCASMSAEECLTADWQAIGYEDGARGAPVSAITPRRQTCAKKAGVTVDMPSYLAGREDGLVQYCTASNGYAVGSRGSVYHGVCSPEQEAAGFLTAYEAGRYLNQLETAVYSISKSIQQAEYDLNEVEHQISLTESNLVSPDTPNAERVLLLKDLKDFSADRGAIEASIIALHRDHARAEQDLADYRQHIAVNGPYALPDASPQDSRY